MEELRCTNCGKVLLEAEGNAHIKKKCPKCKNINEFNINQIGYVNETDAKVSGLFMEYDSGPELLELNGKEKVLNHSETEKMLKNK